ncbi:MAG: 16S rRNA (cytosine(1402)-N(4))-methyltransferase RsmH [Acidobacteria bacterium]|nr:16S rRNA (cytosine(1402)-N(4))-methyltransferase RsmH [Acidobacteriota bacterium]
MDTARHVSVLLTSVVEFLRPAETGGLIVDATLGLGGHAEALLERYSSARLLGIDRDPAALELAGRRLERFGGRARLVRGRHEELIEILEREGIEEVDGVLADLGVSSLQLDDASRGFSFRFDGPLDMRMGQSGESAADLVNRLDARELETIIREYGEEPMAGRIARAIVSTRGEAPIETTTRLADVIRAAKPRRRHDEIDPATKSFQAIRIAVNRELEGLGRFVEAAVAKAKPGARIGVISFHSLEDRIVKQTFRSLEGHCVCPPGFPVCACGAKASVDVLTRRPVTADAEEVDVNPRSRSAKLRVAEKVAVERS